MESSSRDRPRGRRKADTSHGVHHVSHRELAIRIAQPSKMLATGPTFEGLSTRRGRSPFRSNETIRASSTIIHNGTAEPTSELLAHTTLLNHGPMEHLQLLGGRLSIHLPARTRTASATSMVARG